MRRARRLPRAEHLQLDAVLLAGALRALLLQLAHPAVGHGVAQHSRFADDPGHRLAATLEFVYVCAAGEEELVARTARSVGLAHRPVVSAADAPVAFDARDTELQLWVAATLHDTALRVAEAVWGRLPDRLADELLARNGRFGTALGMPAAAWPADRAAFDAMVAEAMPALRFDPTTRQVVDALIAARAAPIWVRLALPLLTRATASTVPVAGLPVPRVPDLLPLARRLAPLWRLLPGSLRRLPARRIIAAARTRR